MRRGRGRREGANPFVVGAVVLALIVVGTYLGFAKSIPFTGAYELEAVFKTSNNIKANSPVRIAGVEVGKVTKVEPAAEGTDAAVVTMELKDNGRPIHANATAKIRPRIFLEGNFFVDLRPGSPPSPRLDDGDTIPINQTATPVQLDQVLTALTKDTRGELANAVAELAGAFTAGFGTEFNRALEFQAEAYRYTSQVNQALLGLRPHDLSDFVRDFGAVTEALDRDPQALKSLVTDFNTTAAALAREEGNLQATFTELPRTLRAADPALDALNRAFPATRRLARAALPGVRSTGPTVDALLPLVRQLRGLVSEDELRGLSGDLRDATPGLATLAAESVPLLRQVRLASSCQNEVILPWSLDRVEDPNFPATGPVFQEAVKFLPGLAGESRSFDANGQWFKVLGAGGVETFALGDGRFGSGNIVGVNPPKSERYPPLRPDVPCETQEQPDLRTNVGSAPNTVDAKRNSPAVRERTAKARSVAAEYLKADLREMGLDFEILNRSATRSDVTALARRAGNLAQLLRLRSKAGG